MEFELAECVKELIRIHERDQPTTRDDPASEAWIQAENRFDACVETIKVAAARTALEEAKAQILKGDNMWTRELNPAFARGQEHAAKILDDLLVSLVAPQQIEPAASPTDQEPK